VVHFLHGEPFNSHHLAASQRERRISEEVIDIATGGRNCCIERVFTLLMFSTL